MKPIFYPVIDNGMGLSVTAWAVSMLGAMTHPRIFAHISGPYCGYNMDLAVHYFLQTECDEMIVIDTDLVFTRDQLVMLMSHKEPLVFGLYPKRKIDFDLPIRTLPDNPEPFNAPGPLCEVACAARGFMRVHRSVFEKMAPHVPVHSDAENGPIRIFWPLAPGGTSEDFAFCTAWRGMGGKILVDKRIIVQHAGQVLFPLNAPAEPSRNEDARKTK